MDATSFCNVFNAKLIKEVVMSSEVFTAIIGRTEDNALTVFTLLDSVIVIDLVAIMFSKTFVINVWFSISTLLLVIVYSFFISSAIA